MDTVNQIEAQLIMRHYEGFTPRSGRIRGTERFGRGRFRWLLVGGGVGEGGPEEAFGVEGPEELRGMVQEGVTTLELEETAAKDDPGSRGQAGVQGVLCAGCRSERLIPSCYARR